MSWIRRRWKRGRPGANATHGPMEEGRSFFRRPAGPFGTPGGRGAASAVRRALLTALDRDGPQMIREIPHAWPVTRDHLRLLAIELENEGLIEREEVEVGAVRFRSTDRGMAARRSGMPVRSRDPITHDQVKAG